MRAVIQRVDGASVSVDKNVIGEFSGPGLSVLLGVSIEDDFSQCAEMANKIWNMRIFDAQHLRDLGIAITSDNREVSAHDAKLPILLISQFTLYADTSRGRRPTWQHAARGDKAEPIYNQVARELRDLGAHVEMGKFGADMQIAQTLDGPVTIIVDL